jgi:hypothetical protein
MELERLHRAIGHQYHLRSHLENAKTGDKTIQLEVLLTEIRASWETERELELLRASSHFVAESQVLTLPSSQVPVGSWILNPITNTLFIRAGESGHALSHDWLGVRQLQLPKKNPLDPISFATNYLKPESIFV